MKLLDGMDMQLNMVKEIEALIKQAPADTDEKQLQMLKDYTSNLKKVCAFTKKLAKAIEESKNDFFG